MSDSREKPAYLEFSCQSIGLCVEPGDIVEETFTAERLLLIGNLYHICSGAVCRGKNIFFRYEDAII
jgi:hypothetical protein